MMRRAQLPIAVMAAALLVPGIPVGAAEAVPGAASQAAEATLVAVRAAHHAGFDRVVFEFSGGLPELKTASWSADPPTQDPSGLPSDAHGNAFLTLVWWGAIGHSWDPPYRTTYGPTHRAFDLPNVAHVVNIGDWESVLTFTIGVMKQPPVVRIASLDGPPRWVVDLATDFPRRTVRAWFLDRDLIDGDPPYVVPVTREVPAAGSARSALERLFAGPTIAERRAGLRFVDSEATGFTRLRISDVGVARVRLTGGCDGHGSSLVTIASELLPTLRDLPRVDWVKILAPDGTTEQPWGLTDSIPACLEP
jgi:hypothetical protein